jgi:protein involved in polysaccharide export with SLBB domain
MGKQAIRGGRGFVSRLRRGGVSGWLFTAVVLALLCGPLGVESSKAQATAGGGNSSAGSASSEGQTSTGTANSGQASANSGTQAPANSTQAPADGTQAPADNTQAPADNNSTQNNTQAAPADSNGSHASTATQGRAAQTAATNGNTRAASTAKTVPVVEADHDGPQEVRQPTPYAGLPSLQDLYTQIPSAGGTLRRFGSEAFLLGTGNANELPSDLPVGPDYVLGPGDNVVVNMWGGHSERLSVTIDRQGQIALPEAGTIIVDGLTIAQAQAAIQKSLGTQFQDEHVEISLGRLRTVRVYVVGDVQRPGAYDVSSLSTPLSVLYAAGGPTSRGSLRILKQYRGTQLVAQIDLYDFLLKGVRATVERLLPGDTIMVPAAGPEVTVEGMVHHPAIYELNGEKTLNQVLDLAGGVLSTASLKQINVARVEAHERRTMLSLDLPSGVEGVKNALAGFQVQGGDDVVISQILPYNQQAVYLQGHVFRPGRYPYHDGMTITDLLHSYQDVLPEPADHAEIIRLQAPDYRPETIGFNLPDVLLGNNPIKLQPFDVIRIFGRYGIDSPRVTIDGEVLRPGTYPMSEGMTVAGLVRMAGGFNRSAFRDTAGLSSYVIENGQKVLVNHSLIDIQKALDGDKQADVLLKPGDVVSIQQLAGWVDIGSSVQINGEVEHPGAYGIEQGERLSSVLKRAGGLREYAYPQAARFERVQVQELGEQARQALIRRIESTPIEVKQGVDDKQDQQSTASSIQAQRDQILAQLRNQPASGRMVINISPDINQWENTPADIELRAGDVLSIPKRPNFVIISGEVYNPTAVSFVPGKDVKWYLQKGGGPTSSGDKKRIFVLRADGSVVAHGGVWTGSSVMDIRMRPGDTIIVPEKILGGSDVWKDIIAIAQITSSIALTAIVAGAY